ncbi:MAG: hypothetical protein ACOYMV_11485, partial [Verrucomicrobiia bacterium]
HRVLGWRLRPFCLYYQFWLDVLDSPLTRGVPASLADLEVACRLCTSGYGEAERAMRPVGKLGQAGWVARWCFSNTQREFGRFDAYLRDYFSPPESRIKAPETAAGKVYEQFPQTLSLAGAIIKHTGWTPEVVWMLPIGQVHWYLAAFLRMDGVETGLITPQDREFIEGIAKERRSKLLAKLKIVPENRKSGEAALRPRAQDRVRKRESGGEPRAKDAKDAKAEESGVSRRGAESAEQSGDLTQSRKVATPTRSGRQTEVEESRSMSRSMSAEGGGDGS